VCPEILKENGQAKIAFHPGDELKAGFLEGAPPITVVKEVGPLDFVVIQRAGERFLVVQLPTKAEAQFETAYQLIPPQRWSEFPDPVNGQST
jgi:hypothetical protein